ncbi:hypothetical protein ACLKA7_000097, partial [Drosophila subpalustris]
MDSKTSALQDSLHATGGKPRSIRMRISSEWFDG